MAFQLISLGVHPFGEDRDNPTPWTGAVQLHSGFVAGGAEAWLRVFGPNGVLVTCRVAATATAVAGQAGPELTPELETFSGAFTLQAGDAMVTFRGPNHPDNQFLDASEPYTWNLGTQYNDITEWFNPAGAAEVFVSIWDGAPLVVEGDAQPAGYSLDVPPATGSLPLVVEGDAQPAGYSLDVPPATGSLPLVVEGDAQPAGYSLDVPPATGSLPLVVEGDAQPAGYSLDVPPATGSSRRSGDAQPAGYSLDVPPATGSSRRSGDAQPAGYSLDVPPAAGGISGTAEHLELATLRSLSGDGPIYAFEFTHPDMPDPVRIVSDGVDHVIEGDVYQAIAVSVSPPRSRAKGRSAGASSRLTTWAGPSQT